MTYLKEECIQVHFPMTFKSWFCEIPRIGSTEKKKKKRKIAFRQYVVYKNLSWEY